MDQELKFNMPETETVPQEARRKKKGGNAKTFSSMVGGLRSILYRAPRIKTSGDDATVIAVCSQKGGVGKTTSATTLGYALAEQHQCSTLIVDLDPQGHVETALTTIVKPGQRYRSLSKVLTDRHPDLGSGLVATESDSLWITPGDKNLSNAAIWLDHHRARKEFILRSVLEPMLPHYDYIILDCPPYMGNLMLNALVAARYCLIPTDMSILALEGVSDMLNGLQIVKNRVNKHLGLLGVLMTRVDAANEDMNTMIRERFEEQTRGYLFGSEVPYDHSLSKSQYAGIPVARYAPASPGARAYQDIATEIVERVEKAAERLSAR